MSKLPAVVHLVLLKVGRNLSPIWSTHKGEVRCKWNTQSQDGANVTQHILSDDVIQVSKVLKGFEVLDLIAKVRTVNLQPGKDHFSIVDGQARRMRETLGAKYIVQEKIKAMLFHAKEPVLEILPQVEAIEPRWPRVTVGFDASKGSAEDVKFILEHRPPRLHIKRHFPTHEAQSLPRVDV